MLIGEIKAEAQRKSGRALVDNKYGKKNNFPIHLLVAETAARVLA